MEIIAKTKAGFFIHASDNEVREILKAVTGKEPDKLVIGQKIPAIDYAASITQVKTLKEDYNYRQMLSKIEFKLPV
jgi:hypothetical protein